MTANADAPIVLSDNDYFKVAEFACHDGTPYPVVWADRWELLGNGLCVPVRRMWGGPLSVVSGYRTPAYNAGLIRDGHHPAADSTHMKGEAGDLKPDRDEGRDTVLELHDMVLRAHAVGQLPNLGGLGLYPAWIHVDTHKAPDGHLRRWNMR